MSVAQETTPSQRLLALCRECAENIDKVKQEAESLAQQWIEAQAFTGAGIAEEAESAPTLPRLGKKPLLKAREAASPPGSSAQQSPAAADMLRQFAYARKQGLVFGYMSLQNGVQELIRALSQRLEHSDIDFEDRLEIKFRLADLNGKLQQTGILVTSLGQLIG
jgi:hypothetical protein